MTVAAKMTRSHLLGACASGLSARTSSHYAARSARIAIPQTRSISLFGKEVATTSRLTLAHLGPERHSSRHGSRTLLQSSATGQDRQGVPRMSSALSQRRSLVTMTRQPEQPEDPDVLAGSEKPSLIVTERAIDHLSKVATKENNFNLALRVTVEPGGCHGYQYKMELTDEVEHDDFRFSVGEKVHLLVDSVSLRLIKGSTIDYVTELIGSQFAIFHNPQAKGAGCGCGVSWEPNL